MEIVRFDVGGTVYGPETEQVEIVSNKLRAFANGTYDGEHIAEIGLGTQWVTHAASVADQIDERRATGHEEPIPLTQDGSALAMYAVLSQTYSDGWDSQQVSELRDALREYLDIVLGP
jgi:glycerol dehydrogenase-like iron-containing ADH family enzyme